MVTTSTQEAPSPEQAIQKAVTKQDVLRLIPQFELQPIMRRHNLKRTVLIGLIGDRGDGKSGSGAGISFVDFMLEGYPVYSNMSIRCDLEIDDETARKYGLNSGGVASYSSIPLDKEALLRFDPVFRKSVIFGDEINMELFDARRTMSNTNLWSANVAQELRHLESHLIYSVIDEMFIDLRLRKLTDIFIKCEDTALSVDGLNRGQEEGVNVKWIVYPMSGYLVGRENSYYNTKKPLTPVYFNFRLIRGIYDDKELQATGKPKYGVQFKKEGKGELKGLVSVDTSEVDKEVDKWGWLAEKARQLKNSGVEDIEAVQLWHILGIGERGITPQAIGRVLPAFGITRHHQNRFGQWVFKIATFDLENADTHTNDNDE